MNIIIIKYYLFIIKYYLLNIESTSSINHINKVKKKKRIYVFKIEHKKIKRNEIKK